MSQSKLSQNTISLQEVLNAVNNLPEAGGGSVAPTLQDKTVTENGTYTADSGYDGLGTVTVNVASSGSGGYTLDDFNNSTIEGAVVVTGAKVRSYCFYENRQITSISAPNATELQQYAFGYCTSATSVNLPEVVTVANGSLRNLHSLESIVLPKATTIAGYGMYYMLAATKIDLPVCTSLDAQSLGYCRKLEHLILRSPTICTLKNTTCFVSTPFASGGTGGFVYVPASLVSSYQTATNWSALAVTFRAIENYPDICG